MGWENRDYARSDMGYRGGGGASDQWPPVVKFIIVANLIVFLLQMFFVRRMTERELLDSVIRSVQIESLIDEIEIESGRKLDREKIRNDPELTRKLVADLLKQQNRPVALPLVSSVQQVFELDTPKVLNGQVWRLVTCGFCHDRSGVFHILFNMLFLYWFGGTIERMVGSREFALFYFSALLVSSLAIVGLDLWTGQSVPAIGASGAVMGVTMLFAIYFPKHTVLLFFVIPVEVRWLVVIYCIYDLYPVLLELAGQPQFTGTAHAGHLGGLAFGFLYWKLGLNMESLVPTGQGAIRRETGNRVSERRARKSGLKVYAGELSELESREDGQSDELDREVDRILRKIQDEGRENLTEEEQQALERASQWYRDRDRL
ncbi:MAG: rhomboid family intramembrane serine protease [Planctomycetota bacterium]|nr:rhomboid family intramembrane serine protease [Planctomycetota bacterium]